MQAEGMSNGRHRLLNFEKRHFSAYDDDNHFAQIAMIAIKHE